MSIEELDGHPGVYVRKWQKLLRVLEIPSNTQYRPPRICELDTEGKKKLLKNCKTYEDEGKRIMKGLTDLSAKEALQYFGVKKAAVDEFCFRLLQDGLSADCMYEAAEHTFIILSYTWHSTSWTPQPVLMRFQETQKAEGPLSPAMWEAFLEQRDNQYESLWVDQLCITHSSEHEKSVAIGSMDLLYRSARKVVVAIEDVAFNLSELELMLSYTSSDLPRSQWPQHDLNALSAAFQKLVKARWFQRAWCLHEFLVSRTHVFLIPISQDSTEGGSQPSYSPSTRIVQVEGPFLVLLFQIFAQQDLDHHRMGSAPQAPTSSLSGEEITRIRRFFTRLRVLELGEVFGSETVLADGSYMHMFSEIWSHDSMYNDDKFSILLNTMNSGLCLRGPHSLSEAHCWLLTTLVALAAGDVTALATNGDPIPPLEEGKMMRGMRWVRQPSYGDQARRTGALTIARRATDAKLSYDGLELEVKFIATSDSFVSPAKRYLSNARWLIDHRSLCLIFDEYNQSMRLDLETDDRLYTDMRLSYIQTLACALQCGRDWMIDCYAQSYLSMPRGVHIQLTQQSKQNFGEAINWALDMNLEGHDIESDMGKSWQEHLEATVDEKEDNSTSTSPPPVGGEDVETEATLQGQEHDDEFSPEEHVWYSLLLDFTETIVSFGLTISHNQPETSSSPTKSSTSSPPGNLVQICNLSSAATDPFLIFAPPPEPSLPLLHTSSATSEMKRKRAADELYLCIPTALLDESYSWMFRAWILSREEIDRNPLRTAETERYSLLGKTKLFGPTMAAGKLDEAAHRQRITIVR